MDWKKILLVVVVVGMFGAYLVYRQFSQPATLPTTDTSNQQENSRTFTDGNYNGDTVDSFYGPVQVKALIAGGKLTDIQLLQYPNKAGHTTEVSTSSLPILKTEAITAQSANVDVVSGATQTSQAFMKSLQSALAQAGSTENFNIEVTPPGRLPM